MRLLQAALRIFFHLLYHSFAWSYDLVAAVVSLGQWKTWVLTVLPYVAGRRVLELGHGPGHLQRALQTRGLLAVGLDESRQMSRQAARRLQKAGIAAANLTRGLAQYLPFPSSAFQTIVSTFPSEYIFDSLALAEAYRVLTPGGRLVILPLAWITGTRLTERFLAWLFRVTGEVPDPVGQIHARLKEPFLRAGFQVEAERVHLKSSLLLFVIARKPNHS